MAPGPGLPPPGPAQPPGWLPPLFIVPTVGDQGTGTQPLPPQQPRPVRAAWLKGRRANTSTPIYMPLLTDEQSGFEGGTTASYVTAGTATYTLSNSTVQVFQGAKSLAATVTAPGNINLRAPVVGTGYLQPGSIVTAHAWVFCATTSLNFNLSCSFKEANGNSNAATAVAGSAVTCGVGAWKQVFMVGTAPSVPGLTQVQLSIISNAAALNGDVIYFDDIDLRVVGFTAPQFPPAQWTAFNARRRWIPPRRGSGTIPPPNAPVLTQFLPPQPARPAHAPAGLLKGRNRQTQPIPPAPAVAVPQSAALRSRFRVPLRRRVSPVPPTAQVTVTAQALPPQPGRPARAAWLPRSKARQAQPVPAQQVVVLHPVPPQPGRPVRARWLPRSKARQSQPVPPGVSVLVPQPPRQKRHWWLPRTRAKKYEIPWPQALQTMVPSIGLLTGFTAATSTVTGTTAPAGAVIFPGPDVYTGAGTFPGAPLAGTLTGGSTVISVLIASDTATAGAGTFPGPLTYPGPDTFPGAYAPAAILTAYTQP